MLYNYIGDIMKNDFRITDIAGIMQFNSKENPDKINSFNPRLYHNELIFHFSGESTVNFSGKILNTAPATIRFLPKGNASVYNVSRITTGECIDIFFDTDKPISPEAFVISADINRIGTLFKKAFTLWVARDDGYYFECISLLYKIFAEIEKQTYLPEKEFGKIKPAVDYINNNFMSENIKAQTLSELCKISYSYIKRLFIKRYNMPPKKYIISLKINYACELLKSGLYTVTEAAERSGYSDIYFFSRQFKEYIGVSPSVFAEKYRSK